jgi:hypothetical protein
MSKAIRAVGVATLVVLFVFSLAMMGCGGGPNEEQLQLLEETKASALEAEQKLADCEENKAELSDNVAELEKELADVKQEKADVSKRLAAMGN